MWQNSCKSRVRLDLFNPKIGLDRGSNKFTEAVWYFVRMFFFTTYFPWPSKLKCFILKIFGAKIGRSVNIQPNVNIHFPWKLEVGDYSWIGQGSLLLNFEMLTIGSNVAIAHRVFFSCGNHNFKDITYSYMNKPITICDGVVIGSNSFIGPGIKIGLDSVITACSVVTKDIQENMICKGNPCVPIKNRWN